MARGLDDWRKLAMELFEEEQELLSLDPLERHRPDIQAVFEALDAIMDGADLTGQSAPDWSYVPQLSAAVLDLLHAYPDDYTHTGKLFEKVFDERERETFDASIMLIGQIFFTYHLLNYIRKAGFRSLDDLMATAQQAEDPS